jgi:hypothetical protein
MGMIHLARDTGMQRHELSFTDPGPPFHAPAAWAHLNSQSVRSSLLDLVAPEGGRGACAPSPLKRELKKWFTVRAQNQARELRVP